MSSTIIDALIVTLGLDNRNFTLMNYLPAKVTRGQITLPGPVNPDRLLAAELTPDALAGYRGLVTADRVPPGA